MTRFKFKRHKRKACQVGIRAKRPHEIWHIDITEIVISNEQKYYLQMIVDNFSRAILSWKISDKKDLNLSLKTIQKSIRIGKVPEYLMSDGGRENINQQVIKLLFGKGISQIIAQADVHFSNSMIEAVFKKFKSVTTCENINTLSGLKRKVAWFVKQYNCSMPHSMLNGALPFEVLNDKFCLESFNNNLRTKRIELIRQRSCDYQQCRACWYDN